MSIKDGKIDYTEAYDKTIEKYITILNKLKEIKKIFNEKCAFCKIKRETNEKCPIKECICNCDSYDSLYYQLEETLFHSRNHTSKIIRNLIQDTIKN